MKSKKFKINFSKVNLPTCNIHPDKTLMTANFFRGPCPANCLYCYAKTMRPNIFHKEITFADINSISLIKSWPDYLFLSSYSEPFLPDVMDITQKVVDLAFANGTFVSFSTKRPASKDIVKLLISNKTKTSVSISLSSLSRERNSILEPGAPSAEERLAFAKNLVAQGISVWIKADTLFPGLDDEQISILPLLAHIKESGVGKIMLSYAFYRPQWKKRLNIPILKNSLSLMSENQEIASGKGFSLPIQEKKKRLKKIGIVAREIGLKSIITCGCKNKLIQPSEIGFDSNFCEFHWR